MESLRLTFPAQQQGQHLLVETDPVKLKRWLNSLPYGDMSRAVPEVCRAIASLNRSKISLKNRIELVSLFDRTYAQVFAAYRPTALHLTNDEQRRQEHNNLHQFTREMAFAHKIIADGELKKRRLFGKPKDLARAINLSVHYLGLLLMEHYESYSPIPVYLWRECNNLYGFAQDRQFEAEEIFEEPYYQCLPTIEQTFARVCMMSMANPYHLSLGEHWQVFQYLSHWINDVEFSDDTDDFSQPHCYVVELKGQTKPVYSSQYEPDTDEHDEVVYILAGELVKQLEYHKSMLAQREMPAGFYVGATQLTARNLVQIMLTHWSEKVARNSQRYPVLTKLDVLWGIESIFDLLNKHLEAPNSTHWEQPQLESFLGDKHTLPLGWEATNVSAQGIGISSQANISHRLKVGELVMIREYIDNKPSFRWRLGLSRWLFGDENQGTRVGIEFIDGHASPARLQHKTSKGKGKGHIALMLKPVNRSDNTTLIASRGTFHDGRSFKMSHAKVIEDIKSRSRLVVTPCIEQFSYQSYEIIETEETDPNALQESETIPWTAMPDISKPIDEDEGQEHINFDSVRLPGDH